MQILNENPFAGLNLSTSADRIAPGELAVATNVVVRGGELETRPGIRGQLSSALAAAPYAPTPFVSGGSGYVLFVSGGSVYKWARGATSPTLLTGGALGAASSNAFIATGAGVGYLVDGALGLYRLNLSGAYAVSGLSKPTAPTPALTARTLEATSTASDWYDNRSGSAVQRGWVLPSSSSNLVANNSFDTAGSGGGADADKWTEIAGGVRTASGGYPHSGFGCLLLALAGDGASQKVVSDGGATMPALSVSGILNFTGAPQKVRTYHLSFWVRNADTTGLSTVEVEVLAYVGGSVAGSVSYTASQAYQATTSQYNQHSFVASFNDLDTDPDDIEVRFVAGIANTGAVYVDDVDLRAVSMTLLPTLSAAGDQIEAQTYATIPGGSSGRSPGVPAPDSAAAGHCHRQYIFRTFGTAQDWRSHPVLSARVTFPRAVLDANAGISLRLGLATASSALSYTAPGVWSDDGKSLIWYLDGLPTATLQSVKYLVVEVVGDQVGGVGAYQALFRIGPIQSVGALEPGLNYWWRLVEIDANLDATNLLDVVESDVSDASTILVPTPDRRMGSLTIPARTNSSATHFALFRYGGTLLDIAQGRRPLGFLVTILSWSETDKDWALVPAAGASPYYAAPANPYLYWDTSGTNAGGTLIDNTPDSWLAQARVAYEGRESPPSAPRDVCLWDGRVWLTTGSAELWGSWKMASSQRAGLYFSRITLPAEQDAHAPIRGWWAKLQLDGDDTIQRIVATPGALAVLTSQGLWAVERSHVDVEGVPIGYTVRRIDGAPGLVARRAVAVDPTTGALLWLAPGGVWSWTGESAATKISQPLENAIGSRVGLSAAAVAASSLAVWGERVVLCAPADSGASAPSVAYVLDGGVWTMWSVCSWTGMCASASTGDAPGLVAAGADGQIYLVRDDVEGDKALSGSTVAAVSIVVRTRTARDPGLIQPNWVGYAVWMPASGTVTFTVVGDGSSALAQALAAGFTTKSVRVSRAARGRALYLEVTASTTARLRLQLLTLDASIGALR